MNLFIYSDRTAYAATRRDARAALKSVKAGGARRTGREVGRARDPLARPLSALAFARELQAVEAELGIAQTQIDVPMYVDPAVSGAGDTQLTSVVPDRRRSWRRRGSTS